jgi:hypothetical protein
MVTTLGESNRLAEKLTPGPSKTYHSRVREELLNPLYHKCENWCKRAADTWERQTSSDLQTSSGSCAMRMLLAPWLQLFSLIQCEPPLIILDTERSRSLPHFSLWLIARSVYAILAMVQRRAAVVRARCHSRQ